MKLPLKIILGLGFFCFVAACKKDVPPTLPVQTGNYSTNKRLLICDEGNFGSNNAAISVFDPSNQIMQLNAFGTANVSQSLGDVLQSVSKFNNLYYLVVNNSGKILVCDKNFVRLTTINGLLSPRYITFVSNNKAYVTNLKLPGTADQTNYIQVIDLNTNTIMSTIHLNGWTEQMVQSYGKVYVSNQNTKYVYVIDAASDKLIDSIFVAASNLGLVKDENEKIWASCNADSIHQIASRLVRINPVNDSIEASISLNSMNNSISRLTINSRGNTLYYLLNDLYKLPITATQCQASPYILQGSHNYYGLSIDPDDESIYISDAVDYNSNGKLYHFQSNTTLIGSYMTGVIPGYMLMDE